MVWQSRVLVVANLTAGSLTLLDALQHRAELSPAAFTLLVPASPVGSDARADDAERLEQALASWRAAGLDCEGMIGDEDPIVAVREIWDPQRLHEIVVCTLPGQASKWMRHDLPHRLAAATDAQVTHVVDLTPPPRIPSPPLPPREKPALGPLSVLAWGGRPETPAKR